MSLGTLGSTLNDELNRLANGGTYRDSSAMVDEALAAKQWANRENISPYTTDTVGVLNEIAGLGTNRQNWLDFNGVCNYIAGTSGLPAAAALRQIYPTTDLLTGVASYYIDATDASASGQTITNLGAAGSLLPTTVGSSTSADSNDPKFLDHTGTNYVYLPGVASNNLSIPSSTALNITGDIDLRAYVASDNWANGATFQEVISKWDTTANTRQYAFVVDTLGKLQLIFSIDGITGITTGTSSLAVPFTNGVANWIRATRAQAAGEIKFFTGTDGINWTQLGTTITGLSTSNFFTSSTSVMLGNNPTNSRMLIGKLYRAQIYSDITETTKVLDVDTSVITAGSATSFTAVTGQTVTINRSTSGRKTVAVTQPTWLFGTDDYMEVNNRYMAHSTAAENYVYLSGASGNYMSIIDNPPLDVTGDLDLRVNVAMDDWTPAADSSLLAKRLSTGNQQSYQLFVTNTTGLIGLFWSTDGNAAFFVKYSTVAPTVTDGGRLWVRATLDIDNGAGGNTVKFFTSTDGTTWTQLGTSVVTAGVTSIYSGTAPVEIGSFNNGVNNRAKGAFYRAQILNGIDGTIVLDADASVITLPSQTTFVDSSSNAYTVTINKSGVGTFVSTGNYMYLPGIASNYASAPDSAALDIVGDLDLRVKVALDDWTSINQLLSKWVSGSNQRSYRFWVAADGKLNFSNSTDGLAGTVRTSTSSVAPTITDGSTLWVRVTCDVDNGASGNDVIFYTSPDGTTWTQLGTTVTTAGTTSIFAGTGIAEIGTQDGGGNNPARGKFFRAQVLNGIGGTLVFDANFENSITSLLQTTFTESSTNGATVTINRSGSTFRSAGVIDAGYLYPGATNTFSNSTTNFLDFGATDSFTTFAVLREWATPTSSQRIINKRNGTTGYEIYNRATSAVDSYFLGDGTDIQADSVQTSYTFGSLRVLGLKVDRSSQTAIVFSGTTNGTSAGTTNIDSLVNNIATFTIGRYRESGSIYADMELVGVAVFRQVLTPAQIRQVTNYFANREVYL